MATVEQRRLDGIPLAGNGYHETEAQLLGFGWGESRQSLTEFLTYCVAAASPAATILDFRSDQMLTTAAYAEADFSFVLSIRSFQPRCSTRFSSVAQKVAKRRRIFQY